MNLNNNTFLEEIGQESLDFNIGKYISEGWQLFQKDAGKFILAFFVYFVFAGAVGMIPFGSLVAVPVFAGFFTLCQKIYYNKNAEIGDMFKFEKIGDFVLFTIVSGLISILFLIPAFIAFFPNVISLSKQATEPSFFEIFTPTSIVLFALAFIVLIVFQLLMFYAIPLIQFKNMKFMDAMKTSANIAKNHLGGIFVFYILVGLIGLSGAILCGLGLFVTIPLVFCMHFAAYKDILRINNP